MTYGKGGFYYHFLVYLPWGQTVQIFFTNTFLSVICINVLYNIIKKTSILSWFFFWRLVFFEVFIAFKNQGKYSKSIIFNCKT